MEKFKVTFEANDQQLKAVGTKHASDTYADIEATFVLGSRWTDMDSVSAVWWNDFTKIATVLDSQGKCIVPHEVLTRKGCVRVNLVGSIVEGDELVTRLTSYSAEAVQVNEKIKLTGTETSEITPSQYEQFVANVKADADRAEAGATESANSAQSASESATASANSASDSAQSATASAQSAQNASESAISAENAKDDAEDARDKILGMRATAETLEAGSDATASYSDGLLTLGIPRGDKGEQGIQGETGATPNFSIGEVDTLEPNTPATATITGTAEDPVLNLGIPKGEQGDVNLSQLEALLPTDTASGSIVTITDGQAVVPAKSLKVQLEPIQDLKGYDKPWVGGAGKNKCPNTAEIGMAWNGSSNTARARIIIPCKPSTTYTLSMNGTMSVDGVYRGASPSIPTSSMAGPTNFPVQITTGASDNYITLGFNKTAIAQTDIDALKLQLEEGSSATSFEPYSNICPISGHTEVVTQRTGKNLCYKSVTGFVNVSDGKFLTTQGTCLLFECKAGQTYVASGFACNRYVCAVYDNEPTHGQTTSNVQNLYSSQIPHAFVTPVDGLCVLYVNNGTVDTSHAQIELGSTATAYEPYDGDTYTTSLGQTVYGGTLDMVSGELVVDRAMVDLGTIPWIKLTNADKTYFQSEAEIADMKKSTGNGVIQPITCSHYRTETWSHVLDTSGYNGCICEGWGNKSYIAIYDEAYVEVSETDFQTAMSGVQLCYELASPQTYQLTPQEVELLLGQNNVWSDGNVTLVYSADIQKWVEKQLGTRTTLTMSRPMVQTETETTETETETETE